MVLADNQVAQDPLLGRVRVMFNTLRQIRPDSSFRKGIQRVKSLNGTLRQLLSEPRLPSPSNTPLARTDTLHQDRHAGPIYNAIRDGYRCNCEGPHFTKFGLPHTGHTVHPSTRLRKPSHSKNSFQLFFSIDEDLSASSCAISSSDASKDMDDAQTLRASETFSSDGESRSLSTQQDDTLER